MIIREEENKTEETISIRHLPTEEHEKEDARMPKQDALLSSSRISRQNSKEKLCEESKCSHAEVLITDDAEEVIDGMKLLFKTHSQAKADYVRDGDQAIQFCRQRKESQCCPPYKLILIDLQLGDVSGYEATKEIRQWFGSDKTKVIAITALLEKFVMDKLEAAGIDEVLYKPLTKRKVISMLAENDIFNGTLLFD